MSQINVNNIKSRVGGAPTLAAGAVITGVTTSTSFAGSGTNLTALNADNISSGIVTSARLGGGTADSTTFLNGGGQFATPPTNGWEKLSTLTLSGGSAAYYDITLPETSTYQEYKLQIYGLEFDNGSPPDEASLGFRYIEGGSAVSSNTYRWGNQGNKGNTNIYAQDNAASYIRNSNEVAKQYNGTVYIGQPGSTTYPTTLSWSLTGGVQSSVDYITNTLGNGLRRGSESVVCTAIRLFDAQSGDNVYSGKFVLYGLK